MIGLTGLPALAHVAFIGLYIAAVARLHFYLHTPWWEALAKVGVHCCTASVVEGRPCHICLDLILCLLVRVRLQDLQLFIIQSLIIPACRDIACEAY